MEQSLHEFRRELSIIDHSEYQMGGYLKYIQSKYPKITAEEKTKENDEWQLEYKEALAINNGNHETLNFSVKSIDINSEDDETKTSEFILPSNVTFGGSLNSPSTTLFDNFVTDDSDVTGIDYGSYIPSGLPSSCDRSLRFNQESPMISTIIDSNNTEFDDENLGNFNLNDGEKSPSKSVMTRGCLLPIESMNVRLVCTLIFALTFLFFSLIYHYHYSFVIFFYEQLKTMSRDQSSSQIRTDADIFLNSYIAQISTVQIGGISNSNTDNTHDIEDLIDDNDDDSEEYENDGHNDEEDSYTEEDSFTTKNLPSKAAEAINSMNNARDIIDNSDINVHDILSREISDVYPFICEDEE